MIYPPCTRLGRHRRYSPERSWEPLSDVEWAALAPFVFRAAETEAEALAAQQASAAAAASAAGVPLRRRPGRPVRDPRARLDAVFWLAAHTGPGRAPPPWHALPARFGKPDTVSRQFRRWARAGLWSKLLRALAQDHTPGINVLRRLESWICRAFRRAWRVLGVQGMALARRLGFLSALRGPSWLLPDPDLSEGIIPLTQVRALSSRFLVVRQFLTQAVRQPGNRAMFPLCRREPQSLLVHGTSWGSKDA